MLPNNSTKPELSAITVPLEWQLQNVALLSLSGNKDAENVRQTHEEGKLVSAVEDPIFCVSRCYENKQCRKAHSSGFTSNHPRTGKLHCGTFLKRFLGQKTKMIDQNSEKSTKMRVLKNTKKCEHKFKIKTSFTFTFTDNDISCVDL